VAPRRVGILALAILGVSAALSVFAATREPAQRVAAAGGLALDAPLPTRVPPGARLVIGDPVTEHVLKHTGWIKELPFQVQWAEITGGPAVTEAFHAKVLDAGTAANIPPIHAIWVGIPVKMVAVRFRKDPLEHPTFELAIAPKAKIASLADLKGKRIAYSPGQVQGEIVLRALQSQGLTPKDVTLVELPSSGADIYANALVGGLVDAAPIGAGAPVKHYLENYARQGGKVLRHAAFRDDLLTLYVREETLRDPTKAAALRAYVRLWGRAAAWMNSHPDEWARSYYVGDQGLSLEDARYVVRAAGENEVPRDWSQAIAQQQGSIDLMARATGRRRFDAAVLFDRRFETVAADAFTEARAADRAASKLAQR
jgi:sulfonate transport system substrate-binding protein